MAKLTGNEYVMPSLAAVQRFFGISHQTSKEWRNQGMPILGRGKYDLKAIFDWWLASGKFKRLAGTALKGNSSLEEEKLAIEVETKRLRLHREAGDLVKRLDAYAMIESMFHRVRTRLEAIPEELGASLPADTRASHIADARDKIRLILREMEHWSLDGDQVARDDADMV